MAEEKFLTVRDVAIVLGVSEKEVVDLVESGALPAYKIGGVYLRFKKEQIHEFKKHSHPSTPKLAVPLDYSFADRLSDFFYFNDFYIIAFLLVALLLYAIFLG
jgi:excisionase family DNA binding protein